MSSQVNLGMLHPQLANLERPELSTTPGLSRALSERFGIDLLLVRLGFLVLMGFGALGAICYLWGWLLTPKGQQPSPLERHLPRFGSLPHSQQWLGIAASSLILVLTLGKLRPVSILPLVLTCCFVWWRLAKSQHPIPSTTDSAPAAARVTPTASISQPAEHLPVLDLYACEDSFDPLPAPPPAKGSWLLGSALVALGVGIWVGLATFQPGLSTLQLAALTLGTLGVLVTAWALFARRRRIPIPVLLVGCLGSLIMGSAVTFTVSTEDDFPESATAYSYVATTAVLDLSSLPPGTESVVVEASASTVELRLPGKPKVVTTVSSLSGVEWPSESPGEVGFTLHIKAFMSLVKVSYP